MKQEMMGWSDINWSVCKSFAPRSRHNYASTSSLNFLQAWCSS